MPIDSLGCSSQSLLPATPSMKQNPCSAAGTHPLTQDDPSTAGQVQPLARSASSVATHHEEGTQSPLRPVSAAHSAGSSGAR